MNDTLKTIKQRYSCRSFVNGKMPDDASLNAIAQAAIEAPSGVNRQHWHISMVKNSTLISQMEAEGMLLLSSMPDKSLYQRIMGRGGKLFYNAPCMAVIAIKEASPKGAELIDLGIVAQNIVLAASSLGIANVHCGLAAFCFAGEKAAEFKEKLQFPQGYEFGIAVLLGYATAPSAPHLPDKNKVSFVE